jgi:hypothetical protein
MVVDDNSVNIFYSGEELRLPTLHEQRERGQKEVAVL